MGFSWVGTMETAIKLFQRRARKAEKSGNGRSAMKCKEKILFLKQQIKDIKAHQELKRGGN